MPHDTAEIAAYQKIYRRSHKAEAAAYQKAYYQAHKAEIAASDKTYRQAHTAELAAYMKAYQQANKAEIAARHKAYNLAHKAEISASGKAWKQANPNKVADHWSLRHARKLGATTEKVSRAVVYERDGGRCHRCGKKVPKKGWHLDHLVPLARGGEHCYRNVAVAHAKCNISKGIKPSAKLRLF